MAVIAVRNTPSEIAPTVSEARSVRSGVISDSTATAIQSLAAPSVKVAAKTNRPMNSVRGSSHGERCLAGASGAVPVTGELEVASVAEAGALDVASVACESVPDALPV